MDGVWVGHICVYLYYRLDACNYICAVGWSALIRS